jgi:aspartate 1-decarboxylase
MDLADLIPGEKVDVVNINNGSGFTGSNPVVPTAKRVFAAQQL